MSVQVKNLTQTRTGRIHVSLEGWGKVKREEAYFGGRRCACFHAFRCAACNRVTSSW